MKVRPTVKDWEETCSALSDVVVEQKQIIAKHKEATRDWIDLVLRLMENRDIEMNALCRALALNSNAYEYVTRLSRCTHAALRELVNLAIHDVGGRIYFRAEEARKLLELAKC